MRSRPSAPFATRWISDPPRRASVSARRRSDIRTVGEELRRQGKDQPAKLAEQAAQRAESLGDYLQR